MSEDDSLKNSTISQFFLNFKEEIHKYQIFCTAVFADLPPLEFSSFIEDLGDNPGKVFWQRADQILADWNGIYPVLQDFAYRTLYSNTILSADK